MAEALSLKGKVQVWLGDELVCSGRNMVVQAGLELFARLFMSEAGALKPSKFKLGNNGALSQMDMSSLQGLQIAECSCTVARRNNVLSWQGEFTYSGVQAQDCRELGLFNEEAEPVMMARFLPVQQFTLKSGTPVRITWEISIGA